MITPPCIPGHMLQCFNSISKIHNRCIPIDDYFVGWAAYFITIVMSSALFLKGNVIPTNNFTGFNAMINLGDKCNTKKASSTIYQG